MLILTDRGGSDAKEVHHDDSIVFGGRFGYWIDQFPYVGVGLDVSHFNADVSPQTRAVVFVPDPLGLSSSAVPAKKVDIGVTVISFDLMLRWPLLTSPAFPKGQLQPYVAAGPAVFIAKVKDFANLGREPNRRPTRRSGSRSRVD